MTVPSPWIAVLLVAASYRLWRLLAEDTILERPRRWLVRLPQEWKDGEAIPDEYKEKWALFITCPWCAGFWISLALWGIWQIENHWTEVFMVPLAISAAVGITRVKLDPPE